MLILSSEIRYLLVHKYVYSLTRDIGREAALEKGISFNSQILVKL
jgi:hypothetical protein